MQIITMANFTYCEVFTIAGIFLEPYFTMADSVALLLHESGVLYSLVMFLEV